MKVADTDLEELAAVNASERTAECVCSCWVTLELTTPVGGRVVYEGSCECCGRMASLEIQGARPVKPKGGA